jgi:hypothetical protein
MMGRGLLFARLLCWLLLLTAVVACSDDDPATDTPAPLATNAVSTAVPTSTATPAPPTATAAPPTATPSPTPIQPAVTVSDQDLGEDGRLLIDSVQLPEPGWLVIYAWREGAVAEVLGQTAISGPTESNLEVQIEPLQATDTLVAMLHHDAGEAGTYEFPGADEPISTTGGPVMSQFTISRQFILPEIVVANQTVTEDSRLLIESVNAMAAGWLLIYGDEAGEPGYLLGLARVEEGLNEAVSVQIPWREATSQLHALLAADNGRPNLYDPEEDLPILVGGNPVSASFEIGLPVDIFILDQPVVNSRVVIERITMNAPGWVVIHPNDNGQPGLIIGFAFLGAGVNEQIVVDLLVDTVTPQMYASLHEDSNIPDEFDFPNGDLPLRLNGRLFPTATFSTDTGNYLITRDQVAGTAITVPITVIETDGWLVIYDNDQQTDPLGFTWLAAGINRNVRVEISSGQAGDMLYATLHTDNNTPQQFEYPDGSDLPVLRGRNPIQAPFLLLP